MGAKYKVYPEYKDSGEEWLGKVPSHWDVIQIKRLSPVKRGASPRPIDDPKYFDDEGEYAWTRIADVTASDVYLTKAPQRLSELGSSLSVKLRPGALFLSIAGTVGKPCITGMKACIHDGFVYFPELKIPNKFLFYVFAGEQAYKGLGKFGTQLNLNTDTVGGIKIGCTTNDELNHIVDFLDHETAKIDTLIEEQQSLIRLLQEKRQAVISHAVTKGLNPDAPMKDSGVEWLGEVPEHWAITPLRHLTYEVTVGIVVTPAKYYQDSGIPCFRSLNVKENRVLENDFVYISEESNEILKKSQLQTNDIVVVRSGQPGTAAVVGEKYNGVNCIDLIIIRQSPKFDSHFLCYQLNSEFIKYQVAMGSGGAIQQHFNVEIAKSLIICDPPLEEQTQIRKFIKRQSTKYQELIDDAESQVTLLQERRTALISAAVTGKIDVRDWQAPEQQKAAV